MRNQKRLQRRFQPVLKKLNDLQELIRNSNTATVFRKETAMISGTEIRRRLCPLRLMERKEAELTSEDWMKCEMPNNPDRLMNSDYCQNLCYRVSTSISSDSELMTESEVIQFLRIPELSSSQDYPNVIENLKRVRGLPRIHISCRFNRLDRGEMSITSSLESLSILRLVKLARRETSNLPFHPMVSSVNFDKPEMGERSPINSKVPWQHIARLRI